MYVSVEYICYFGIKIRFSRGIGIICECTGIICVSEYNAKVDSIPES